MQDNEKFGDATELTIGYEEIISFFSAIQPAYKCPVCRSEKGWKVMAAKQIEGISEPQYMGLAVVDRSGNVYPQGKMPMVVLTCNNCGNVRFHSVEVIQRRLPEAIEAVKAKEGGDVAQDEEVDEE